MPFDHFPGVLFLNKIPRYRLPKRLYVTPVETITGF